ncbi:hypothetical protein BRC90_03150 [Halobacteriales archaeon QS_4_69_34]|nr:MAG: hypothetical protein BRC90_03150 [Halobacteriales archaeon QS_4_69_34]
MFVGGSVGSTGGAVEIARWPVIGTSLRRERFTTVHPAAASPWGWAGAPEERAIRGTDPYWLLTHVYCWSKKIIKHSRNFDRSLPIRYRHISTDF